MENKKRDINEFSERILQGVKKAIRNLVETSAANNKELVIGDKDGTIRSVPAKDLLKTLPK